MNYHAEKDLSTFLIGLEVQDPLAPPSRSLQRLGTLIHRSEGAKKLLVHKKRGTPLMTWFLPVRTLEHRYCPPPPSKILQNVV